MTPRHLNRRLAHLLVTATLFLGALAAEVHPEAVTVSPGSPSFSVDFGTVAPGDMLELTITGLPEGLKSASASPSEGAGAWAGGLPEGVECGTAVFTATIPSDFSGEHTGNFAGEFCLSGDGDGDGSGPTWSGTSTAEVCACDCEDLTVEALLEDMEFENDCEELINAYSTHVRRPDLK